MLDRYVWGGRMNKVLDFGNGCVDCYITKGVALDTSFGSGRFVNRIPAENDEYEGYLCFECQCEEDEGI